MILFFDYFETLLSSKSIDFNRGLKVFWENSRQPGCLEEKVKAIEEALRYFQMI